MFAYFTVTVKGTADDLASACESRGVRFIELRQSDRDGLTVMDGGTDTTAKVCATLTVLQDWYAAGYHDAAPYPVGTLLYFYRLAEAVAA